MHTLRYYEKEELLPPVERDKNRNRKYSDLDVERLILIRCMRAAGMSIAYIKDYMKLSMEGFSSISARKKIILLQKKILDEQKRELDKNLEAINLKLEYYQELEDIGPEEYANIANKKHAAVSERLAKLLKNKSNTK